MAERWPRELANTWTPELQIKASSAELEANGLKSRAVQAMKNSGANISDQTSSVLTGETLEQSAFTVRVKRTE